MPDDYRPKPVQVVNGWIPAGRHDSTPGFDVRNCPVVGQIYDLLPAKGAIPALEEPRFTSAEEATWLGDEAPVLGLKMGQESRCYPLAILNWHCLVHDRVNGQAVYIFWDPPSGLSLARRVRAASRPLGLAGLGYRGISLAYEKSNGVLWDLFDGVQLSFPGLAPGTRPAAQPPSYDWLPLERMSWAGWRRLHGQNLVLSRETGYGLDYGLDPYAVAALGPGGQAVNYWTSPAILAPDELRDASDTLPDKTWVLGVLADGEAWALPLQELATVAVAGDAMTLKTASASWRVRAIPREDSYFVEDEQGRRPPQVRLLWFAWKARFPDTRVLHPAEEVRPTEE